MYHLQVQTFKLILFNTFIPFLILFANTSLHWSVRNVFPFFLSYEESSFLTIKFNVNYRLLCVFLKLKKLALVIGLLNFSHLWTVTVGNLFFCFNWDGYMSFYYFALLIMFVILKILNQPYIFIIKTNFCGVLLFYSLLNIQIFFE